MKEQIYQVDAESFYGEGKEEKRQKQIDLVASLGLVEREEDYRPCVYCNGEKAIQLILGGYCGDYLRPSAEIRPIFITNEGPDLDTVKELMSTAINGVKEAAESMMNTRCNQHQPGNELFSVDNLMLVENSCTDALQDYLNRGWRIIAVQPQPDQRRPDYILGRTGNQQTSALRG